jgi:hypothetical protein
MKPIRRTDAVLAIGLSGIVQVCGRERTALTTIRKPYCDHYAEQDRGTTRHKALPIRGFTHKGEPVPMPGLAIEFIPTSNASE